MGLTSWGGAKHRMRSRPITVGALVVVVLAAGGFAFASFVGGDGVIHGCVSSKGGLRLVKPGRSCPSGTSSITWYDQKTTDAQFVHGTGGLTLVGRRSLDHDANTPHSVLLDIPNIGRFEVACSSTDAELFFYKPTDVPSVDVVTERIVDPAGNGTSDTVDTLTTNADSADQLTFAAVPGIGSKGRYVIQINRVTAATAYVATVTVSLTSSDDNVQPGSCLALGHAVVNSAPA
jgi:hypothetical protein